MKQLQSWTLRLAAVGLAAIVFGSGVHAQEQPPTPASGAAAPAPAPDAKKEEMKNPFAAEAAPPLPAGMSGSDASDPRYKLTPGMYDAGETSLGLKHLTLLKKPEAFQLGATSPDDPKVAKALGMLGIPESVKMPKDLQLVIAGLAFSNSDFAFQGNHLFQGNFYGFNIFDISEPTKAALLTSVVCPGGQGDLSVYKNLLLDRKSTRLNSSHLRTSRMPSSA